MRRRWPTASLLMGGLTLLALVSCGRTPTAPSSPPSTLERTATPSGVAPTRTTGGPLVYGLRVVVQDGVLAFNGTADEPPDSLNHSWILSAAIDPDDPGGPIYVCRSSYQNSAGNMIVYLLTADDVTEVGSATLNWSGRRFRLSMPLFDATNGEWGLWTNALTYAEPYTEYLGTFVSPLATR